MSKKKEKPLHPLSMIDLPTMAAIEWEDPDLQSQFH